MTRQRNIIVAVTGASGALYATRTLAALLERGCHVDLIISDYGRRLLRDELGEAAAVDRLTEYLAEKFWKPIGARDAELFVDRPEGLAHTDCCMWTSIEDWARVFGLGGEAARRAERRGLA